MGPLVEQFAAVYRDQPDRPLIVVPALGRAITAREIWEQHHTFVRHFGDRGMGEGDLLVCGTGNRPELLPLLLACRALNIAVMAVDAGATRAEVTSLCAMFGAKSLLTFLSPSVEHLGATEVGHGLALVACGNEPVSYPGAAVLKLTSGSSGPPRATRTTETQLIADGTQIIEAMGIGCGDTQLASIPLAHSYGLGVLVMPLLLQGTGLILRESFVPQQLANDARQFGARRMPGVPFMFEYLVEHMPAAEWPPGLITTVSAGAPLSPLTARAFHDRFGVKVHAFYGTSETGGISYDASDAADTQTLGRPLPGVSLTLRPMDGIAEDSGRVHVRGPAVSHGYVGGHAGDFTDGGFLTADYGRIGADGRLTLLGRVSSFINVAGRKVQPDEVELVLRGMPGIADARVVGAPDARRGQQVVACLVARAASALPSAIEIRRYCASRLAAHKIPRMTFFVESIPLNARGKTDRARLDDLVRARLVKVLPGGMV